MYVVPSPGNTGLAGPRVQSTRIRCRRLMRVGCIVGELRAHFGQNGERAASLKKWRVLRPPVITIFHGADAAIPSHNSLLASQYAGLIRHGALNLTVNKLFRDMLVAAGASQSSTAVHHMGI